ncbi:MAG: hypothetical protein WBQ76_11965, partial [Candidatus Korobacteraceae bacterium]
IPSRLQPAAPLRGRDYQQGSSSAPILSTKAADKDGSPGTRFVIPTEDAAATECRDLRFSFLTTDP